MNHDWSFENAYAWSYDGSIPRYYGAWEEALDLGPGVVECGAYWFTQIGYFPSHPMDAYVWRGGVSEPPGAVLCLVESITGLNIPFWPSCGENTVELGCEVIGEFTIGFWGNFDYVDYWVCADENGPGGCPWTCIAPGIGYPTGWQHPSVVFPDCRSLGIGVYFGDLPSSGECRSWGAIRALFRED